MDKFGVNYGAYTTAGKGYLDYDRMKDYLHEHEEDETDLLVSAESDNSAFLKVFFEEIGRVDYSYSSRLESIVEFFKTFEIMTVAYSSGVSRDKRQRKVREATLKRNAAQIYKKIHRLEEFCLLNKAAAIKILKKYDKLAALHDSNSCLEIHIDRVQSYEFGNGYRLTSLKRNLEILYADLFCDGELEEAQLKLNLSKTDVNPKVLQAVALKLGIIAALAGMVLHNRIISPHISMLFLLYTDPSIFIYAAVGALISYRWFWGFNVYMWDRVGVDYVLVLSLDPNKHMPTYADIYSDAGTLTVLYLLNVLVFNKLRYYRMYDHGAAPTHPLVAASHYAWVMPVALVAGTLVRVAGSYAQSTSFGVFSTRIASRLARTPFMTVFLRDNFAANILSSLTSVWSSMLYGGCYFVTGSYLYSADPSSPDGSDRFAQCTTSSPLLMVLFIVKLLPSVIRFLQCLRQRRDFLRNRAKNKKKDREVSAPATVDYTHQPDLEDVLEENLAQQAEQAEAVDLAHQRAASRNRSNEERSERSEKSERDTDGHGDFEMTSLAPHSPGISSNNGSFRAHSFTGRSSDNQNEGNKSTKAEIKVNREGRDQLSIANSDIQYDMRWAVDSLRAAMQVMWIWPHSFNALRYFLSICVVVLGAYPPQDPLSLQYMCWYIPLYVIATLYNCYWDAVVDYQLLQFTCPERPLLREKLFYEDMTSFYYFVLVANPILRFFWMFSFTPYGSHPFFVVFEIARRSFWAVLRMEVAHIQELSRHRANP